MKIHIYILLTYYYRIPLQQFNYVFCVPLCREMLRWFDVHGQRGQEAQTGAPASSLQPAADCEGIYGGEPSRRRSRSSLREAVCVPDQSVRQEERTSVAVWQQRWAHWGIFHNIIQGLLWYKVHLQGARFMYLSPYNAVLYASQNNIDDIWMNTRSGQDTI